MKHIQHALPKNAIPGYREDTHFSLVFYKPMEGWRPQTIVTDYEMKTNRKSKRSTAILNTNSQGGKKPCLRSSVRKADIKVLSNINTQRSISGPDNLSLWLSNSPNTVTLQLTPSLLYSQNSTRRFFFSLLVWIVYVCLEHFVLPLYNDCCQLVLFV